MCITYFLPSPLTKNSSCWRWAVRLVAGHRAHPTDQADLFGMQLVSLSESDEGRRLAEGTAKRLTSGDTVRARRMQENFWEFEPSHPFVYATNHRPLIHGTDHAI